ncbi:3-oxoadipate enol-lactonase [Luteimonas aquatica]|uniref:3-oxoadipate enol-lactonase n=1 Tax=Luteimonas aquatica TaxID=450364 RepID=UPI001F568FA4|nr:3-oxoadipate enol-lactonase [Luteimonas aquatica]
MPFLDLPQHRLHYRIDGDGKRPWLLLCNSIGTDLHMWDEQIEAFSRDFRVLRYDRRGHARSSAPPPPWTVSDLGRDVLALLDALDAERVHFCGLSLGGLIGQWLALHAPRRIGRLVVCSTAAKIGSAEAWRSRIALVRERGMDAVAEATPSRWFTDAFAQAHPERVRSILATMRSLSPEVYAAYCGILIDADFRAELADIAAPLLAVAGRDDATTTPADLKCIAHGVADGRYLELPGRHLTNVESAAAFTPAVLDFLHS